MKAQIDRKLLITCNYQAIGDILKEQVAVIESRHRNKEKLSFGDKKWVQNTALENTLFAILKHWALDNAIMQDLTIASAEDERNIERDLYRANNKDT